MNYIFIGGTPRGFEVIRILIEKNYFPDYVIVLKEDEHETVKASVDIIKLLEKNNISYSLKKKIGEEEVKIIKEKKRDFALVCGWRTLIDTGLSSYFKVGFLAAHDSLLPAYRGFAPINWAMICGEKVCGVTLFQITEGETDSGPVYKQKVVTIEEQDYAEDVYKKIILATKDLCLDFIESYSVGKVTFTKQDESAATYTCKRTPQDGRVNWNNSSTEVVNFIRALAPPYPGAFCYFQGEEYIICKASLGVQNLKKFVKNIPGRVIQILPEGIEVMCGSGTIFISQWGKKGEFCSPADTIKSISTTLA